MQSSWANAALLAVLVFVGNSPSIFAQEVPWVVFPDLESAAACDVVNAGNLEFVVLGDTGALVVVTDEDYRLDEAANVNEQGVFFFGGLPLGQIAFAVDGGGFRTLWLLDLADKVLELDRDTGEPTFTDLFPDDFLGAPCDAFALWDDDDFDEVSDESDDCPLDFGDYRFGCPCEVFDDDDDDVDNCFDECPGTPLDVDVDARGCPIIIVVQPPPVTVVQPPPITIVCGSLSTLTMALTFGALVALRLSRRRYS